MTRSICLLVCSLFLLTGCANNERDNDPNSLDRQLKAIRFVRTGGGARYEKRIEVNPSGFYRGAYGADMVEGKLGKSEKARLAAAFSGWDKLETSYPPREGANKFYSYWVLYDDKIVTASSASPNLPKEFERARKALEGTIKFK